MGTRVGIFATVLATLADLWFVMPGDLSLFHDSRALLQLSAFCVIGIFISLGTGRYQSAVQSALRERLRRARSERRLNEVFEKTSAGLAEVSLEGRWT